MRKVALIAIAVLLASCSPSGNGEREAVEAGGVTFNTMTVERLPDLSRPRYSDQIALIGNELTVFGGHTDGFKPVNTAEYYSAGAWHEVEMMYTHDNGTAVELPDGRMMLMGGTPEDFGIGQSWAVEIYDPRSHGFSSPGILDRKRARSSALALPDGSVAVCGNWYADDGTGIYREGSGFHESSAPSVARTEPIILPASENEILIFSSFGTRGEMLDGTVDILEGETFHEPLLDSLTILEGRQLSPESFRIAPYTYLLAVRNRNDGSYAVLKIDGKEFSLLDMDKDLPPEGRDGELIWTGNLMVVRPEREAWIQGFDGNGNIYLACIDYDAVLEGGQASVTFYCAAIPGDKHFMGKLTMLPESCFAMLGGVEATENDGVVKISNFSTSSAAYILHIQVPAAAPVPWTSILTIALALLLAAALAWMFLRRKRDGEETPEESNAEPSSNKSDLMSRITALMEEKELFRRSDLKLADLAAELGTNVTYISACINGQAGVSFNEFVTRYRVRYAQTLMSKHPEMKLTQVSEESGFSGERSFFRNFKKMTDVTPRQWVDSLKDS